MIVVDCSYTMAMVMPDESRPQSLARTLDARLFVPSIWPLEVANALRNGVRRRRLDDATVPAVCARLADFEVEVVHVGDNTVLSRYRAAAAYDVTPYDAAYLELSLQRHCALATLDARLAEAARRAGVPVLD